MYFSELQAKMLLKKSNGERLGTIRDAEIDVEKGKIDYVLVDKHATLFTKSQNSVTVPFDTIHSIGDAFVFVNTREH